MSIPALNWVKRMHPSRIKATARSVLREMADFADEQNECWPSVETLSFCTSLSTRAVQEAIRALEQLDLVVTRTRCGTSSRYRLNVQLDMTQPRQGAPAAPPLRARRQRRPVPLSQPETPADSGQNATRGADFVVKGCASCTQTTNNPY